jgi:hypothetical protein
MKWVLEGLKELVGHNPRTLRLLLEFCKIFLTIVTLVVVASALSVPILDILYILFG